MFDRNFHFVSRSEGERAKGEIDYRGLTTEGKIRERAKGEIYDRGERTTKKKVKIEKERGRKGKREREVTKNVNSTDTMFDRNSRGRIQFVSRSESSPSFSFVL